MALVKKIELELHGELGLRRGFYLGLYDSNGDAYNFSEGINFPPASQGWSNGIITMSSEFSLNNDPVGSVTVAPAQQYGEMSACIDPGQRSYLWWRGNDRSPWANNMLCFIFGAHTDQPAPWSIILTFSKAIDIYKVSLFQDDAGGGNLMGDLGIKVIGENQSVLASMLYTVEQQNLDYPVKEVTVGTYPYSYSYNIVGDGPSFIPPLLPLNLRPTLPKSIKVMSIGGGLYIRPKQA